MIYMKRILTQQCAVTESEKRITYTQQLSWVRKKKNPWETKNLASKYYKIP